MSQYIYNVAKQILRKLPEQVGYQSQPSEANWGAARELLKTRSPATLGKIACAKRASSKADKEDREFFPYSMHGGTWLSKYDNGQELLLDIATTVVFCAIGDLIPKPSGRW